MIAGKSVLVSEGSYEEIRAELDRRDRELMSYAELRGLMAGLSDRERRKLLDRRKYLSRREEHKALVTRWQRENPEKVRVYAERSRERHGARWVANTKRRKAKVAEIGPLFGPEFPTYIKVQNEADELSVGYFKAKELLEKLYGDE